MTMRRDLGAALGLWLLATFCLIPRAAATSDILLVQLSKVKLSKDRIEDAEAANVPSPLIDAKLERRGKHQRQEDLEKSAINQGKPPVSEDEAPVERTAQHGGRWWRLNLTKSLGLLQTSGTVTRNTVLDPAILVIGLVSIVIALSAFMAFCTSSSSGKRKVTRCPAPATAPNRPAPMPAMPEDLAQKGRCLSTALRARGSKGSESMRPSEVNPTSSLSVPAASDTSLPPPQEPKHIGGEEGGMFNWSPRSAEDFETLCPCLVVPDGMEFVFAVREVLTVVRQELSFSVVDLDGSPLSHIIVNETGSGPQCGIFLQMLDGEPLASIRTDMLHSWPGRLPEMCYASGEVFGRVAKGDGRDYVLRDNEDRILLRLEGNFKEKTVKATSWCGELIALSERCIISLDGGAHYQVRVAPGADAGLVLCSLLAMDKIEGGGRSTSP